MALQTCQRIITSVLATIPFFFGSASSAVSSDESKEQATYAGPSYELGQGLRLGESGFTLGGYASAQYQDLNNSNSRAALSHLSMFLWWENGSRLKFFSELDRQDRYSPSSQSQPGETRFLAVERMYFDYTFSDSLTLRAGKFLTPIGRWNLLHADPLVWTTSRPLITSNLFPDNATGLMAFGSVPIFGRQAEYTLYASPGSELRADPAQDPFNDAYGVRLNLPVNDNTQFGLSYAIFDQRAASEERKQLFGLDVLWSSRGYELSSEVAYRMSSEGAQLDAKGGFIQGVVPMVDRLYAVGRIEAMRQPDLNSSTSRLWVLGLNYRYSRALSFKVEYVHYMNADNEAPEGVLASVSVLF
jgi:hypothetical protein